MKTLLNIFFILVMLALASCSNQKEELHVYTWSDYIDTSLIEEFETLYNCKVIIDTFDSNESMYSKIKSGASGYDILVPTSYMAKLLYEQNLIIKLDHTKIPNIKYIDKEYITRLAFDKKMEYSIPYMLGYTCIAYNKEKLGQIENSWNIFSKINNKGRMTMLDDYRETIGAGLMYSGHSINSTKKEELEKAKYIISNWKKNLAKFDNEVYKIGIASGEFLIVQGYSGDLLQVLAENKNLEIMIPKEGVSISCDDMVIPTKAPNKELAYKFISFLMEPKNAAKNMEYNYFFAPIPEAKKYVKNIDLKRIFPQELYKSGQLIKDLGNDNIKYLETWNYIKSKLVIVTYDIYKTISMYLK